MHFEHLHLINLQTDLVKLTHDTLFLVSPLININCIKKCVVAICVNAVTLVSDCLLFLAEEKAAMRDKISTNNMVVILNPDRIIKVL